MFNNLSDRLADTFKSLRSKGRLSAADIDTTLREIRRALLEADVALDLAAIGKRVLDFPVFDEIRREHQLDVELGQCDAGHGGRFDERCGVRRRTLDVHRLRLPRIEQ